MVINSLKAIFIVTINLNPFQNTYEINYTDSEKAKEKNRNAWDKLNWSKQHILDKSNITLHTAILLLLYIYTPR